ncbi:ribosomal-protein-alanine N-acetyltransferase [Nakamurella antarctica]|uniref:[Ribosomal protein bS18]-alanine N-acetyltransferase n=2 Tax=Nakamurella antarctica TaxID=1902245 RepID=A0A3G8ZQR9_9ACTN|nr:ribosomal-protein-alanine N-acetyltransferase [Nakamurella antarctica]
MRWWDIEQVTHLEEVLFPADSPWTAAMFWSELAQGHHYVVAREGERVLGYAGLARSVDLAEVQTIGVHPSYQGRGLGRNMMDNLLEAAAGLPVMLEVRTDNTAAIALYESLGFVRLSLRRNYYQPSGADAYTMERKA